MNDERAEQGDDDLGDLADVTEQGDDDRGAPAGGTEQAAADELAFDVEELPGGALAALEAVLMVADEPIPAVRLATVPHPWGWGWCWTLLSVPLWGGLAWRLLRAGSGSERR